MISRTLAALMLAVAILGADSADAIDDTNACMSIPAEIIDGMDPRNVLGVQLGISSRAAKARVADAGFDFAISRDAGCKFDAPCWYGLRVEQPRGPGDLGSVYYLRLADRTLRSVSVFPLAPLKERQEQAISISRGRRESERLGVDPQVAVDILNDYRCMVERRGGEWSLAVSLSTLCQCNGPNACRLKRVASLGTARIDLSGCVSESVQSPSAGVRIGLIFSPIEAADVVYER